MKRKSKSNLNYSRDSTRPKWRIFFSGFLILLLFLSVGYKALSLQVLDRDKSFKIAKKQHISSLHLLPKRGNILDSNKRYLATSVDTESIYLNPKEIKDKNSFVEKLSKHLPSPPYQNLSTLASSNKSFLWLERLADKEKVEKIKSLNLKGLGFVQEPKRIYPNGHLLGQVLGFTNIDSKGIEGTEYYFDGILAGKPRKISLKKDARGKKILHSPVDIEESTRGFDIILTIDSQVQHIVEQELKNGIEKMGGESGMAIVMDPNTGAIISMASYPFFNPNDFKNYPEKTRRNLPVWYSFEPGSTLKIFLVAAALEEKLANPTTTYNCENGRRKVGPKVIKDVHPHGVLTVAETMEVSSNICASKIGEAIGKKELHEYLSNFGFGEKIGVDLPGEPNGSLLKTSKWGPVELATISFGQGISVTAVQLASALSTIANGGYLMKPHIVRKIINPKGKIIKNNKPHIIKKVISYDTSVQVANILEGVVEKGTGKNAKIPGYRVAGKTGTAQVPNPNGGGYYKDKYMSSFIGFAPIEEPRLSVVVIVNDPKKSSYGGTVAAPIFKSITEKILFYLGVPTKQEFTGNSVMPNFEGKSTRDILKWSQELGVEIKLKGSGYVIDQFPIPGEIIEKGTLCSFKLKQDI